MTGVAAGEVLLGKLRVVRALGEGATSVVYEVEHLLTKHRRALKVLRPELARSGEAVARLVREAGAAGKIRSPFVAETFDVGRLPDGATYVLAELVDGEPLRAVLAREGSLSERRAVELAMQLCEGLAAVHGAGIVHRDIKPENLMVSARGEGASTLRILDFGAMAPEGGGDTLGALTAPGALLGTPRYMAPEQLEAAPVDPRTDVYTTGVVLFEMLAGRRPFEEPSAAALVRAILAGAALDLRELAPSVDPDLAAIVARAMHRDRDRRFPSADALRSALAAWTARRGPIASPLPPGSDLARRFDVVRRIGAGGMGAVFEVIERATSEPRALKLLLPALLTSDEARRRFAREARAAARIDSAHVVQVLDAGVDEPSSTPYLVMELLRGEDLATLVARRGPLPPAEAVALVAPIAAALDLTHAAGVVHRDLTPANVFLVTPSEPAAAGAAPPPVVKLLDFGIAHVAGDSGGIATGGPIGTPAFMAPEQLEIAGSVGPPADRLALAHVTFTLLAGAPYWSPEARSGLAPLFARLLAGPTDPATTRASRLGVDLPPAFDAWFAKATAVAPPDRFASATEQLHALRGALAASPAAAGRARRSWRVAPQRSRALVAAAVLLAGALAVAGLALRGASGAADAAGPLSGSGVPVPASAPPSVSSSFPAGGEPVPAPPKPAPSAEAPLPGTASPPTSRGHRTGIAPATAAGSPPAATPSVPAATAPPGAATSTRTRDSVF